VLTPPELESNYVSSSSSGGKVKSSCDLTNGAFD